MQIKHQMLSQQLQKKIAPVYLLTGQDNYLIEEALTAIKSAIKAKHDVDEKLINITAAEDWNTVLEEANSYSLFSETVLLNILYEKKTLDAAGKKTLTQYLNSINSRCFIVIRATEVPAKQLQWLSAHEQVTAVVAYPLTPDAMKTWIANQFKKNMLQFDHQVPELIYHYTQGNMLACSQVIEKIALSNEKNTQINTQLALEHLSDQCDHSLFELATLCLSGQADKAIHILRQAANNKTESTLVLWILTQEVRKLLQITYSLHQGIDFKAACSELKIWPQQTSLYQNSIKRMNSALLQNMLSYCQLIDTRIKSNLNTHVWDALEKLSLSLCLGKWLGEPCAL